MHIYICITYVILCQLKYPKIQISWYNQPGLVNMDVV